MSNESERVEDLEQRVKELEATVRGLTEELVEANERIRQLEDEHDLLEATGVEGRREQSAGQQAQQSEQPAETEGQEADAADADEEPKSEDAKEQEEEEESGLGDDIIVA